MYRILTSRYAVISAVIAVVLLSSYVLLGPGVKDSMPVVGNNIDSEALAQLRARASAGDPEAQYGLTLFVDSPAEADVLIEKSARAGYAPAIVLFADSLMDGGKTNAEEARRMLESAAMQGHLGAITALITCVEAGKCGVASKQKALTWTIVSNAISSSEEIKSQNGIESQQRLQESLRPNEVVSAEGEAKLIVEKIKRPKK